MFIEKLEEEKTYINRLKKRGLTLSGSVIVGFEEMVISKVYIESLPLQDLEILRKNCSGDLLEIVFLAIKEKANSIYWAKLFENSSENDNVFSEIARIEVRKTLTEDKDYKNVYLIILEKYTLGSGFHEAETKKSMEQIMEFCLCNMLSSEVPFWEWKDLLTRFEKVVSSSPVIFGKGDIERERSKMNRFFLHKIKVIKLPVDDIAWILRNVKGMEKWAEKRMERM
jgi:hypothetical protein